MATYYVKIGKRYVPVGNNHPKNYDGLYLHQTTKSGSRDTSVSYWLGNNFNNPVDLERLTTLMRLDDDLAQYIMKIQEEDSPEYKQLKEDSGGYVTSPPKVYNISAQDLAVAVLRFLFNNESIQAPGRKSH